MAADKMEGQIDFLGLIEEYTDDQGATVRVKSPSPRKLRPRPVKSHEQLKLDFIDLDAEYEKEQESLLKQEEETKAEEVSAPSLILEPVPDFMPLPEEEPDGNLEEKPEKLEDIQETVEKVSDKKKAVSTKSKSSDILFKQCKKCWCYDCKHNSRNEGIPREMCGNMMPCPACKGCIDEDMATICEIGNAKEGCRLRATEEGLLVEEEF